MNKYKLLNKYISRDYSIVRIQCFIDEVCKVKSKNSIYL